jgi:hypothetical protein
LAAVPFPTKDKDIHQLEWTLLATKNYIIAILGLEETPTRIESDADLDTGQIRKYVWDKSTDRKRRQAEANTEKCLDGNKLTKCNNISKFAYMRGMAGPQVNEPEEEDSDPNKKKPAVKLICAYCDKKGHKMTKSQLSLFTSVLTSSFNRSDNVERPSTGKSLVHYFVPWFFVKVP